MHEYVRYALALLVGLGVGYYFGMPKASAQTEDKGPRRVDLSVIDGGVYRVRKVVDGDTIVLENGLHVRYNGMNAPETGHFVKDAAPIAIAATKRNISLVEDKRVRLRLGSDPIDMYGRVVAHVIILPEENKDFTQETDAGYVLVKEGLARSMGIGISKEEFAAVKKIEDEAKAAKVGLWGFEDRVHLTDVLKPYCATSYANGVQGLYHLASCSVAQKIKPVNRHEYATIEEAEAAGLRPHTCVRK